eukprot:TRINITY_DN3966_c0_g2_i3.p2 TRINITY_DN3966_c0_g2~~TRINITY_DN3966_c0_g2_i3.p2  ORF type:complete len:199 (+),score=-24.89 TRINITY_DN3966_c0_g2_i3:524-1120(+)
MCAIFQICYTKLSAIQYMRQYSGPEKGIIYSSLRIQSQKLIWCNSFCLFYKSSIYISYVLFVTHRFFGQQQQYVAIKVVFISTCVNMDIVISLIFWRQCRQKFSTYYLVWYQQLLKFAVKSVGDTLTISVLIQPNQQSQFVATQLCGQICQVLFSRECQRALDTQTRGAVKFRYVFQDVSFMIFQSVKIDMHNCNLAI